MITARWLVGFSVLVLVALTGWWALVPASDPELEKVRQLRTKLETEEELPEEKRRETFEELRETIQRLPPEKKEQARGEMREMFQARITKTVEEYFALPEDQRVGFLDRHIEEMEKWMAQRRQREQERQQAAQEANQQEGQAGAKGEQAGSAGPGGRRGRNLSEDERRQRRNRRLNNTTPELRAKFTEFFTAIQQRRRERGLPEFRRPRR